MGRTLGIGVGGTALIGVIVDEAGEGLGSARMRTPRTGDRGAILEVLVACAHEAASKVGHTVADLDGVGVASPGAVVGGTVGQAMNLPGWGQRFGLAEVLEDELDAPIRVVNDVTAAAVAEHHSGAARSFDHVLVTWLGTGVGAGLILEGRIYEGAFGVAGEFGHTVVERGGAVCPCGRRGCVEAYAGRRAMENSVQRAVDAGHATSCYRIAEDLGADRLTEEVLRRALEVGDPLVADLVDDAADALGKGIASAVNLVDVEAVVLGGPLADELGAPFVNRVDAAARPNLFLQPPRVDIVPAELGDRAGPLGAALLAAGLGADS